MKNFPLLILILSIACCAKAQLTPAVQQTLGKLENLRINNRAKEALALLEKAIENKKNTADEMVYFYAQQSLIYGTLDSLLLSKSSLDNSEKFAQQASTNEAKAMAYRAEAALNRQLGLPDEVVTSALKGLRLLEKSEKDPQNQYALNYLLYGVYSRWNEDEKMNFYIRQCEHYARKAKNNNSLVNVYNGLSSMFQARYEKQPQRSLLDSSFHYLQKSFGRYQQARSDISPNSFVITCINLANFYFEFSKASLHERKKQAFHYLALAETELKKNNAAADYWVNVYGIKSDFALLENNLPLAEQYLLQSISQIKQDGNTFYKSEYTVFKHLAEIATKKNDLKTALNYQQTAEQLLKKTFDQQQLFNVQKLAVQYETEKKNQQLLLLSQKAEFRKKQNYLYGGLALAMLLGLGFMFRSYHFRLRYSIERERKLQLEKQDGEKRAAIQLQLEKEEQARLRAEQELLELKRKQLEKEALASSLMIEHKNDMLQQIKTQLNDGDAAPIKKLLKEEMLISADFQDVINQIQLLHPDFFSQLSARAVKKLTPLDLKYCAYIHLQMSTNQIAQAMHVEAQSVRMFKYRLKQKFGLDKDTDLEKFLRE
ncbi:helix-turn-helix transcriptional regulator [Sphingobacterium multivorum]|uniref:helix-turn-helix transcriptional regulator n=1 Tax=Sphingobacterium multivorum TaxID=28454 RepID=UPI003DA3BCAB